MVLIRLSRSWLFEFFCIRLVQCNLHRRRRVHNQLQGMTVPRLTSINLAAQARELCDPLLFLFSELS